MNDVISYGPTRDPGENVLPGNVATDMDSRGRCRRRAERHPDASKTDRRTIVDLQRQVNPLLADERTILTAEIFNQARRALDDHPRVVAGKKRRVENCGRARPPADCV